MTHFHSEIFRFRSEKGLERGSVTCVTLTSNKPFAALKLEIAAGSRVLGEALV